MVYSWHDKQCQERIPQKNHSKRGSVIVWGYYSAFGNCLVVLTEERMNAANDCEVLEERLICFVICRKCTEQG